MTPAMNSTLLDVETGAATPAGALLAAQKIQIKIKQDLRMGRQYQQGRINWITAIAMGLFHLGALAALFFFSWKNLAAF